MPSVCSFAYFSSTVQSRLYQSLVAQCWQVRDVSAHVASLERAPAVQQRSSGSRSVTAHFRDSEIVSAPVLL